jgi:predicted DNA-binding protein (UPF0251 family)/DNA-directed RNA polymerase subunit RPC12/RpoP
LARPVKWRRIEHIPHMPFFIPSEKEAGEIPGNTLKLEELEAVRLKDLEGLEQSQCAEKMGVSRPTFQRILLSAREKIADSLVNGKMIRIEGGNFTLNICQAKCMNCGHEWKERYENTEAVLSDEYRCPVCGSGSISCIETDAGRFCKRHCRRQGRYGRGRGRHGQF